MRRVTSDYRVSSLSAHAFLAAVVPDQAGCAILDIRMPEMDRLALQQEMIRRGLTLPVIIITGHGDVPRRGHGLSPEAVRRRPGNQAVERDQRDRRLFLEIAEIRRRYDQLSSR